MKQLIALLGILAITTSASGNIFINNKINTNKTEKVNSDNNVKNHLIFSEVRKNNKGEIYSIADDGLYKYFKNKNTFIKLKGVNGKITDLKFDTKDNIYVLKNDGVYKCLFNENEFQKMKTETLANYAFTNIRIDLSDNVYIWSSKNGIYRCLNKKNVFQKIGGIDLSQTPYFTIRLYFSKNNVYVWTSDYNKSYNKNLYILTTANSEFTLLNFKSNDFMYIIYDFKVDSIGNCYILCQTAEYESDDEPVVIYKFLFAENKFEKIIILPSGENADIHSDTMLIIDRKNNIYVLHLNNHIYKCLAGENKFKKIKILGDTKFNDIANLKFDSHDNIYLSIRNQDNNILTDIFYKCLAGENEFKPMIIDNKYSTIFLITDMIVDYNDNIYALDNRHHHIYKCLAGENEFKLMTGLPEKKSYWFLCVVDYKNNIYAWFKNYIYKCLAGENEFKLMTGLPEDIKDIKFDYQNNIYALANNNHPYKCLAGENEFKEIIKKELFNNDNLFQVKKRSAAHDFIKIKISYNDFSNMQKIYRDENPDNFKKLFSQIFHEFPQLDSTDWFGSILPSDYDTAVETVIKHFKEINEFCNKLSQGQGIEIVTNRIGSWDKNDYMGVFSQ